MKYYGIDEQYILGVVSKATLPSWDSKYTGSLVYAEDTKTMYYATDTDWKAVSTSALAGYVHTQGTASATWNVVHDLGEREVSITVYDSDYKVMMPQDIEATDENNVVITFSEAVAGRAVVTTGLPGTVQLSSQKRILTKATSLADHDWKGTAIVGTAGAAISRGQLVYCKLNNSAWKYYPYDADATDKLILPSGLATDDVAQGSDGNFLTDGEMRDDTWALSGTADASTTVYASTTAGGLTMTAPAVSGNEVVVAGMLIAANVLQLQIGYAWVEVK